jgi:hypothetical protein
MQNFRNAEFLNTKYSTTVGVTSEFPKQERDFRPNSTECRFSYTGLKAEIEWDVRASRVPWGIFLSNVAWIFRIFTSPEFSQNALDQFVYLFAGRSFPGYSPSLALNSYRIITYIALGLTIENPQKIVLLFEKNVLFTENNYKNISLVTTEM